MSILSFMRSWLQVQPASAALPVRDAPSGERVGDEDVLALSSAYACVRLISGTTASLPLRVMRGGEDGLLIEARDHWASRLLRQSPNDELTAFEFWEHVGAAIELKGNAIAVREKAGSGRTVALEPKVWGDQVQARRTQSGALEYERDKGRSLSPDEVLHIRGFGGDALGAPSTIALAGAAFGLAKAVNRSAAATFRNGIRSQVALAAEKDLTAEQMEATRERLETSYAGAMNAGRPLILNGGFKAVTLSMNPEDAQMLESRGFSVEEVCRFFGVPPFMVGHTEKTTSWGSGVEQAVLGFQKFTMAPRLKRIEQALMKQLLTAEDRAAGIRLEFNVEGLLRGDSAGRAAFYKDMAGVGAMTINEIRAKENLPPVAGGDEPRLQMQMVPLSAAQGSGTGGQGGQE